jgi:hypothetical protein
MGLQTPKNKALSRGIIRKSVHILAEITIRKSQSLYLQPLKFLYDKRLLIRMLIFLAGIGALAYESNPAKAQSIPGTVVVNDSNWLKGSGGDIDTPDGVPVCHPPYIGNTCGGQEHVGGVLPVPGDSLSGWWQCVELAQRLYYRKRWYNDNDGRFSVSIAAEIYTLATLPDGTLARDFGFERYANGSITRVMPGDMIVHTTADGSGAGHVSIIDTIDGSTIGVKEQNWNGSGTADYYWSNGWINRGSNLDVNARSRIQGVVHPPRNNKLFVTESDLDEWCVRQGADEARLINNTAYGWACYRGGAPSPPGINMLAVCENWHPRLNYVDFMGDFYDPWSWGCFGPVELLGGPNLPQYCVNHGFNNASLSGSTVDDWYCTASNGRRQSIRTDSASYIGEFSMAQACKEQYNLPIVRARVADHNNANSVQCWGSRETPSVPKTPSDISLSMTSGGAGIGVTWKDNSDNEAGFDIFSGVKQQGIYNGVKHTLVTPNQTCLSSDYGLKHDQTRRLLSGQEACFQISAYNAAGSSMPTPWKCMIVP